MRLTRRFFLKASGIALVGWGVGPRFLARAAAATAGKGKILVVIFQRGAADGLNIVVPHAEKTYYDPRPPTAIPRRLLRLPSRAGGVQEALRREAPRRRACRRLARLHALALRRPGLHGNRHAGIEEYAGRLAEPVLADDAGREAFEFPRGVAHLAVAAHPAGPRPGAGYPGHPAIRLRAGPVQANSGGGPRGGLPRARGAPRRPPPP